MEQVHLYRKSSMEHIQSPEQLNDYLRITNPSVWLLLTAVILLLVGLLVWGSLTYIDSVVYAPAEAEHGTMTIRFDDEKTAEQIEIGMRVTVGETSAQLRSLGRDERGLFALADVDLADGAYEACVHYKQTQVLRLLFR